ncbi:helix-turn-helix domain-containing protein [Amycolatopsis suaedae]|uniref:Helix-turn-helix domain-containing protein n=1 Tax=Amycolatopsis suaedae TaxID=2510978 RepID=A0A4Q7J045_9PSEU|nr:helix-turn-helix domain-containing protein [Amycolatopsis suaedae]RZQ60078.1 helix-turn-helix domain-containing protein [Amycolatopsis suaedae]
MPNRSVAVLAYEDMTPFESGIVVDVFSLRWDLDIGDDWYDVTICAERPGAVRMKGGVELHTPHGLDVLAAADTVVVPSVADPAAETSPEVIAALRLAHSRGARLVSICSGAFALAATGLLDGLRATTHWTYADLLRRRFPAVEVDPHPLYVDNGRILTSAGCAAGIDLCLHIVRSDFGATIANAVARRMVVPPHRDGGQAQYIETPVAADPDDDRIARSIEWALRHLTEDISVATLAERAAMSSRTYLRHFARTVGTSPIKWLIARRVHASLSLLETTDLPIEEIATRVGFDTAVTYRHHFTQAMRTSPSGYRRTFRQAA